MTLEDLISSLLAQGSGPAEAVEVLLATRRVRGVPMEDPRQAWLREIAAIEVGGAHSELYLVPASSTGTPEFPAPVSVATLQAYAKARPHLAGCQVFVADAGGELAGGGSFSMNVAVLAARAQGAEVWLLQAPEAQWPAVWFLPPAGAS